MTTKNVRRPSLAALLSAASLGVASPADADASARTAALESPVREAPGVEALPAVSLRQIIDERLHHAAGRQRHEEIEQLGTLWMTLAQRDQLDRVVEQGDGFVNVALKNQRYSELRAEARRRRTVLVDRAFLEELGRAAPDTLEEKIDVERFVGGLAQPYQGAVELSLEGCNHREIAERMGVTHAAARKWAQRLRERVSWPEE